MIFRGVIRYVLRFESIAITVIGIGIGGFVRGLDLCGAMKLVCLVVLEEFEKELTASSTAFGVAFGGIPLLSPQIQVVVQLIDVAVV
jgi:hypothetical protein